MKLDLEAITANARTGQLTLRIQDARYYSSHGANPLLVDYPDEWFTKLRGWGLRPLMGKERTGVSYLTKKGYQNNRHELVAKWMKSKEGENIDVLTATNTWDKFADEHFDEVESALDKQRRKLKKQLNKLDAIVL